MLGRTCLYAPWRLGGMTDEVSTVACWIGYVYMHQSRNMNCENEIKVVGQTSSARLRIGSNASIRINPKLRIVENKIEVA